MIKNNFNINFVLDKNYLVKLCIRSYQEDKFNKKAINYNKGLIINFNKIAKEKSENIYNIICKNWNTDKYDKNVSNYLNSLINIDIFREIVNETNKTIPLLEKEWGSNFKTTSEYIYSLGIKLEDKFTVYVNHPIFLEGQYWGDGVIIWSYRKDFPNYNTIYIWHEILHEYIGKSDKEHALIELITDNEMRRILNNTQYPPFIGHKDLEDYKSKINPKFQKFLLNKNTSVLSVIK